MQARVLQVLSLLTWGAAAAILLTLWPHAPGWAVVGAVVPILIGPVVLALQFAAFACYGRDDPVPVPAAGTLFKGWLQECGYLFQVFHWRQPFRWRALDDLVPSDASGRTGVVLIHGYFCNRGFWNPWMAALRARGIPHIALNLEPLYGSIDHHVVQIDAAVQRLQEATGCPPVLVCHSMGGLAARAWLRTPGAGYRVAHVVTIASPHAGLWFARYSLRENGRQMRQANPWLAALADHERRVTDRAPFTCWYSDADNLVFPVSTATLPGADNRLIRGEPHVAVAFHPEVLAQTLALVEGLSRGQPAASPTGG